MHTQQISAFAALMLLAACHGTVFLGDAPSEDDITPPEPCEPGVVEVCGTLAPALDGVGTCRLGERVCPADGSGFLGCSGEVVPQAEDCTTAADETCDGEGACVGLPDWAAASETEGAHVGYGVVAQADGSVVVVGTFNGTLDLGAHPLTSEVGDAFIIKLSAAGEPLWSLSGGGSAAARGVAVNPAGELVVVGSFVGDVDFGAVDIGAGPMNGLGAQSDIFALRITQDGTVLSQRRYGGYPQEWVESIAVGADGTTVIIGGTNGASDVGGGTLPFFGESDLLLMSLAADHTLQWAHTFGGPDWDYGMGVAVNGQGDVAVSSHCTGAGVVSYGVEVVCDDAGQAIVMAFDRQGKHRWTRDAGGGGPDQARSIASNSKDQWVVAGLFTDTLDFGGTPLTADGSYEGYLSVLDEAGTHLFSRRLPSPPGSNNFIKRMRIDGADNIVVFGAFRGTLVMDGAVHENPDGTEHLFAAKFTPGGEVAWSRDFGDSTTQRARDLSVAPLGDVVVTGDYAGQLDFGDGVTLPLAQPAKGPNLFVAHYTP